MMKFHIFIFFRIFWFCEILRSSLFALEVCKPVECYLPPFLLLFKMHFTQKVNHNSINFLKPELEDGSLEDVSWSMSQTKLNQTLRKTRKINLRARLCLCMIKYRKYTRKIFFCLSLVFTDFLVWISWGVIASYGLRVFNKLVHYFVFKTSLTIVLKNILLNVIL